jgi:hypothetical protein
MCATASAANACPEAFPPPESPGAICGPWVCRGPCRAPRAARRTRRAFPQHTQSEPPPPPPQMARNSTQTNGRKAHVARATQQTASCHTAQSALTGAISRCGHPHAMRSHRCAVGLKVCPRCGPKMLPGKRVQNRDRTKSDVRCRHSAFGPCFSPVFWAQNEYRKSRPRRRRKACTRGDQQRATLRDDERGLRPREGGRGEGRGRGGGGEGERREGGGSGTEGGQVYIGTCTCQYVRLAMVPPVRTRRRRLTRVHHDEQSLQPYDCVILLGGSQPQAYVN